MMSIIDLLPGQIDVLQEGRDIALVAMGSTVHEAVSAAAILADNNISAAVVNVSSIRPCDTQQLFAILQQSQRVITIEEHNINGGVGSLVAEVLAEAGSGTPLVRLGIPDGGYAIAADRAEMRAYHGFDAAGIVARALRFCRGE